MFKQFVAKAIAARRKKSIDKWSLNPILTQQKVFKKLITSASKTKFGLDHNFNKIKNHKDYVKNIPIRDYEGFKSYIELIKKRRKKHIMERSSYLLCNNFRNHFRNKIHPHH